jgi:hypothetical protein
MLLLATALAGPTTCAEPEEQRDLPRALHQMPAGTPTLVVQGSADDRVPPRAGLFTFSCASVPKRLLMVHDGDHWFSGGGGSAGVERRQALVAYLRGWAAEQLRGAPAPEPVHGMQTFESDDDLQGSVSACAGDLARAAQSPPGPAQFCWWVCGCRSGAPVASGGAETSAWQVGGQRRAGLTSWTWRASWSGSRGGCRPRWTKRTRVCRRGFARCRRTRRAGGTSWPH